MDNGCTSMSRHVGSLAERGRLTWIFPAWKNGLACVLGLCISLVVFFPASWAIAILYQMNPALTTLIQLTNIHGSIWHGQAVFSSAVLQIPVPFSWQLQRRLGLGWNVELMGHQSVSLRYQSGGMALSSEGLTVPLSIFTATTQTVMGMKGTASGELFFSGAYQMGGVTTLKRGEGELRLNGVVWDTPLQTLLLGNAGGHWQCSGEYAAPQCKWALQPEDALHIDGQLTLSGGSFSGEGSLQPSDPLLQQGLKLMPPQMLAPLQLTAPASPSGAWRWQLSLPNVNGAT